MFEIGGIPFKHNIWNAPENELQDIIHIFNQLNRPILIEWNISCPNASVVHNLKNTLPNLVQKSNHPIGINRLHF